MFKSLAILWPGISAASLVLSYFYYPSTTLLKLWSGIFDRDPPLRAQYWVMIKRRGYHHAYLLGSSKLELHILILGFKCIYSNRESGCKISSNHFAKCLMERERESKRALNLHRFWFEKKTVLEFYLLKRTFWISQ